VITTKYILRILEDLEPYFAKFSKNKEIKNNFAIHDPPSGGWSRTYIYVYIINLNKNNNNNNLK
jgi:hypothetical protein